VLTAQRHANSKANPGEVKIKIGIYIKNG